MFDFTSKRSINRMMRIVNPLLDEIRSADKRSENYFDCYAPISCLDITPMAVYQKSREMLLAKLWEEIGFTKNEEINPNIVCDGEVLYSICGQNRYQMSDEVYDVFFDQDAHIPHGPFFWMDELYLSGGFGSTDDLTDYYFTEEGLEYFGIDDLRKMKYSTFKKQYPAAYKVLKSLWKKPYAEEMTQALYKDLACVFEEMCYDEFSFTYSIAVNVAIVPFIKALRTNTALRRDKVSKFAIRLIRNLRYMSPASDGLAGIMHGFTKNYFYASQMLGSGGGYYGSEIFPMCLSMSAQISMKCIDYVLAYLDSKYEFLPSGVRQLWQKHETEKEAANS